MIDGFIHKAPTDNHYYEQECFKRDVIAIWLVYRPGYVFNGHSPHRTIWGFWSSKTKQFYAPKNSKTVGDVVNIQNTTPYSAMPINLNPLEMCLYA